MIGKGRQYRMRHYDSIAVGPMNWSTMDCVNSIIVKFSQASVQKIFFNAKSLTMMRVRDGVSGGN